MERRRGDRVDKAKRRDGDGNGSESGSGGGGSNCGKGRRRFAKIEHEDKQQLLGEFELWPDDASWGSDEGGIMVLTANANEGFSSSSESLSFLDVGESGGGGGGGGDELHREARDGEGVDAGKRCRDRDGESEREGSTKRGRGVGEKTREDRDRADDSSRTRSVSEKATKKTKDGERGGGVRGGGEGVGGGAERCEERSRDSTGDCPRDKSEDRERRGQKREVGLGRLEELEKRVQTLSLQHAESRAACQVSWDKLNAAMTGVAERTKKVDEAAKRLEKALIDARDRTKKGDEDAKRLEKGMADNGRAIEGLCREMESSREFSELLKHQLLELRMDADGGGEIPSASSTTAKPDRSRGKREDREPSPNGRCRKTEVVGIADDAAEGGPTETKDDGTIVFTLKNALRLFDRAEPWISSTVTCKQGYALGVEVKAVKDFLKVFLFVAKGHNDDRLHWPFDLPVKLSLGAVDDSEKCGGEIHFAEIRPLRSDAAFARPSPSSRRNPRFDDLHLSVDSKELMQMVYRGRAGGNSKVNDLAIALQVGAAKSDEEVEAEVRRRAREGERRQEQERRERQKNQGLFVRRAPFDFEEGRQRASADQQDKRRGWAEERGSNRYGWWKGPLDLDPDRFRGRNGDVCDCGGDCSKEHGT